MKRRNFLKTVVGIVGAAVVGARVETAPALIKAVRGVPFVINESTTVFPKITLILPPLAKGQSHWVLNPE